MSNKREYGQYYTVNNPFQHELFKKWMELAHKANDVILEPFAGANNILKLIEDAGYKCEWKCYDIDPPLDNSFPKFQVEIRDTIEDFPVGYEICITNCPYLGKSSARRRKIYFPWEEDDMYKVSLNVMLNNCKYVAAIIPESFISSRLHHDRLYGVISLTCKMFEDTECPVCLALFTPYKNENIEIYSGDTYLGTYKELSSIELTGDTKYHHWVFNDKTGNIGVKTVDNQKEDDCKFFYGEEIEPNDIKVSSRAFTRISGLPETIDRDDFISECNQTLSNYREATKDVLMTSFKGLRSDGKYRRRLDFRTVRCILNSSLRKINNKKNMF
jgi:hypothetical protein